MWARGESLASAAGGTARSTRRATERQAVDIDLTAEEAKEGSAPGVDGEIGTPRRPTVDEALALAAAATAPPCHALYHLTKRAIDVVLASVLLVVMAPVIAVIAIVIKLDSRGPAIFVQQRVGANGRLFRFYKFRTMHVDARERFPELYAYDYDADELEAMFFKLPYDPRCTRVGKRLRRTSLDELPNLFNVLKGDMTFVGPRPEIPEMLPYYEPEQYCKFAVTPGMTGLAQVSGRNILRFVETNAKDIEYVRARSLRLDVSILVRTVGVVVLMIGAH